ncbi:MAG: hypothetical protein HOW73_22535 [Polyangiaceae bacterium]|nr:hypothetical protein [Polyangiaceae bacterium]
MTRAWVTILLATAVSCDSAGRTSTGDASRPAESQARQVTSAARSPNQVFWDWFVANEDRIYDFESNREAIFDEVGAAMRKVHPDLTFEVGVAGSEKKRDFVISADGIKDAFPAVEELYAAAPDLPRWQVVKFRPRVGTGMTVEIDGVKVEPEKIRYRLSPEGGKLGIVLCMEGMTPTTDARFKQAGYLLLDGALGEYDVETKVGFIDFVGPSTTRCEPDRHLADLARDFDAQYNRLSPHGNSD